jgi:hypothetical protein
VIFSTSVERSHEGFSFGHIPSTTTIADHLCGPLLKERLILIKSLWFEILGLHSAVLAALHVHHIVQRLGASTPDFSYLASVPRPIGQRLHTIAYRIYHCKSPCFATPICLALGLDFPPDSFQFCPVLVHLSLVGPPSLHPPLCGTFPMLALQFCRSPVHSADGMTTVWSFASRALR